MHTNPQSISPVAILRTPFAEKFGVPRQSGLIEEAEATVEFLPEFSAPEFTRGLEAFSHVWLVTGFHKNPPWNGASTVRPPRLGGNERVGVFASRAPTRPNGLGLSLVRLISVEPGQLRVAAIDCVDGTPVYDIKPYLPWCEALPEARADWAAGAPEQRKPEQVRIPEVLEQKILNHGATGGPEVVALIRNLLRLNLQPAYLDDPDRTFGMTVSGWNIRWCYAGEAVELFAAEYRPAK